MVDHLLPPTYTKFEKALSETLGRVTGIDVPVDTLWDPMECPEPHLPWLAWALSVDTWDADWPEQTKRKIIASSPEIHRFKGTRGAVERALAALGASTKIEEWFEQTPQGEPGTFSVTAFANEHITNGSVLLTAELQEQLRRAVTHTKPLSRTFSFQIGAGFKTEAGLANVARAVAKTELAGEAKVPGTGSELSIGSVSRAISHVELSGDMQLPGLGIIVAMTMTGRSHSLLRLQGELVE